MTTNSKRPNVQTTVSACWFNDIRTATTQQPGEKAPRLVVERGGKTLNYDDLTRMTVSDLTDCKIAVLGVEITFQNAYPTASEEGKRRNTPQIYKATIGELGSGTIVWGWEGDTPAISALHAMCKVPTLFIRTG